jgi:hypothetical protein
MAIEMSDKIDNDFLNREIERAKFAVTHWLQWARVNAACEQERINDEDKIKLAEAIARIESNYAELENILDPLRPHNLTFATNLYGLTTVLMDSAIVLGATELFGKNARKEYQRAQRREEAYAGVELRRKKTSEWHARVERIADERLTASPHMKNTVLTDTVMKKCPDLGVSRDTVYDHLCKWRKNVRLS